jgi:ADP-ribose pyrophosphatase YjhB (NUDIX family)
MMYRFQALEFCPQCGEKYEIGNFDPAGAVFLCPSCGYDFYQHSAPSAVAVIPSALDPAQVLMITRRTPPNEGLLALPGGILRHGEHPASAAVRETVEETTLRVRVERLLCATPVDYNYRGARISMLELAYVMRPVVCNLAGVRTPEAARIDFLHVDELLAATTRLAFPEQGHALDAYRRSLEGSAQNLWRNHAVSL